MKYISTYKNIKNSKALDEEIKQMFEKLEKHLGEDYTCYATISLKGKSPFNECVEITIKTKKQTYRAESVTDDFYESVKENYDKIKRQIKKYKTRVLSKKRNKNETNSDDVNLVDEFNTEECLIRNKRLVLSPMSIDEAILQIELLDHDFFLFINEKTNETNLIYKRKDKGYGIIEIVN